MQRRNYNRPNINNTRKEDKSEVNNRIRFLEEDDSSDQRYSKVQDKKESYKNSTFSSKTFHNADYFNTYFDNAYILCN